ncbi:glycosyltransferase family 2 protein [Agreia sp. PsM10]|uniref:glycosyltransferase family 2 protein n=1 Tax=Agreia sp. PsM10 TaxID=3030533 RepID=UPI00263A679F|nr:glycosyltransferase family 2 protein [Agreia sp. PsM10]MDN4639288.1 glycosyltransferase family 2 protein [Agreia sp. PsM10]
MPHDTLRATVIVVNFNGGAFVLECIESLSQQKTPGVDVEVVVVDNASTDGSDREIAQFYPDVRIIRSPKNIGFAGGVNLGIANSTGDVIVLINNDAVAAPGFLSAIVEPLSADGSSRTAAVTARILLSGRFIPAPGSPTAYVSASGQRWERVARNATPGSGIALINSTGNQVSRSGNGRDRSWLDTTDDETSPVDVFGFSGGGAAIRRAALDSVGLFDERLFMYYEDTDLSWRLRRAGWQIVYAEKATVWHRHAASSGIRSPFFLRHNVRNRILVTARNAPAPMVVRSIVRTGGSLLKAVRRLASDRRDSDARVQVTATAAGLVQAMLMLPSYLSDGRRSDRAAKLPRSFVSKWTVQD